MATVQEFIDAARAEIPAFHDESKFFNDLPYIQVGCLAQIAQRAKGADDWTMYQRVVNLADRFLPTADDVLRNALNVAFLEHLDFIGPRGAQAWKLMSPRLRIAWKNMTAYNDNLEAKASGVQRKSRTSEPFS